jgi:hypothetical protein
MMGSLQLSKISTGGKPIDAKLRILIPIDASENSYWCIRYAIELSKRNVPLEVLLLFIAEPVKNWEVLRFHTESEIREHFHQRSEVFLSEAANLLKVSGIACSTYFREADPIQGIVEFAEEKNCSEIVVPDTALFGLVPYGLASRLPSKSTSVAVTRVNHDGVPAVIGH